MAKTFQDLLNEGQAKVLGIVSIVPMDDWNTDTQYQKLNLVRHNGAAYLAKGGSKNVEPGVTQDWQSSWMLVYLDGILSPDGTYPNLTAGRVMHALAWGNKNYDGSSAQTITAADLGLADVYKPQGSVTFANLPATPNESNYGYVWNITNDFTTDSRFIEGAGKSYSAGTNVGVIEQDGAYYYDIFGAFVDLSNYATVASLNAEITRAKAAEQANATAAANAQTTANAKYTKPSGGIPKSDLAQSVQDSLDKANSALQSAPVTSVNGKTGAVSLSASDVGAATSAQGTKADQAATDIANIKNGTTVVGAAEVANSVHSAGIGSNTNINNYYGADYWGKEYYFSGGNNPQGSPEGISGGHLSVIRAGSSTTIQVIRTGVGSDFSGLPTTYQRDWNGSVWTDWEEIVTSNGNFPTLGAGYLAKELTVSNGANTNRYYKLCTFTSPKIDISNSFIFLINGIYGDQPTPYAAKSGVLEWDIRSDSNGVAAASTGISILGGNLSTSDFFFVISEDLSTISLYCYLSQQYGSLKITELSNSDLDYDVVFDGTAYTSAPSGAVYAVNRNVAAKGITPATSSDSDDVATTEWVNNALPHLYLHRITVTANGTVGAARFMWFSTSSAAYTLTSLCGLIYLNYSTNAGRIIPATGSWSGDSTRYYMTTYFQVTSATTAIVYGIARYISGNNLSHTSGTADVESISDTVTQLF